MNAEVYLFGDLGAGYTQYVNDSTKLLFKLFVDKAKANSQLIVHREDTLMYYTYIRRFRSEESSNRYIGISYVLNNIFIKDFNELFSIFERTITTIVSRGVILEYTNNGQIVSSLGKIYKAKSEFAHISTCLKTELDAFMAGKDDTLPVLDYSINTIETKIYKYTDDKSEIIQALSIYSNVFIIKDKDYDSPESKSYANILYRLNKENTKLKDINAKLNRQKKRTTIVIILSVVLAIGVVAIIEFANRSSEQKKQIVQLRQDCEQARLYIDNLKRDSVQLETQLVNTRTTLWERTSHMNRLQQDSIRLVRDNKRLSSDLIVANTKIDAYKKTIDKKNKQIKDKDKTISSLQFRLQSISTTTAPITISSVSIGSTKRNGNPANNFGSTIYSSSSYYIKVKMTYICSTNGYKNFTIKLYGPSSSRRGSSLYASETERVYLFSRSSEQYTFNKVLGKNGNKLPAGKYCVEVCYDGQVLKREYFTINK